MRVSTCVSCMCVGAPLTAATAAVAAAAVAAAVRMIAQAGYCWASGQGAGWAYRHHSSKNETGQNRAKQGISRVRTKQGARAKQNKTGISRARTKQGGKTCQSWKLYKNKTGKLCQWQEQNKHRPCQNKAGECESEEQNRHQSCKNMRRKYTTRNTENSIVGAEEGK